MPPIKIVFLLNRRLSNKIPQIYSRYIIPMDAAEYFRP
jgi:hypothetical protein